MKREAGAAGQWLRAERERLGWSVDELRARIADVEGHYVLHWAVEPTAEEIERLESEQVGRIPDWFRMAREAIELTDVPIDQHEAWRAARNPFYCADGVDMARPLITRDEHELVQMFASLTEKAQDDLLRFLNGALSPYIGLEKAAERFLMDLG